MAFQRWVAFQAKAAETLPTVSFTANSHGAKMITPAIMVPEPALEHVVGGAAVDLGAHPECGGYSGTANRHCVAPPGSSSTNAVATS